jgi:acetolactate synthase-1/2/3 large subunit
VTKRLVRVERAEDLYREVFVAGLDALAAPRRPVYVEVPTDFLSAEVPVPATIHRVVPAVFRKLLVDDAVSLLASAQRPLVWAGGGAVDAASALRDVAERLGAPVLTSYGGRGLLPPGHPLGVVLPPHEPAVGALWDDADVVLCVGSDLDAMNTQGFRQPQPPSLVTIDLVKPVNYPADVWVRADAREALEALSRDLPAEPRTPWAQLPRGREHLDGPETQLLDQLESALPDDAVVVADMCIAGYWFGGYGRVPRPRGLAYPVGWGTLGFGFPAALGAAASGRPTVALVGDGGFLFACGDLATAAQERLPVTVVLVDDGGYGMLAYDFTKGGETPVGCDLEPPDFVALAQAFRVHAERVDPGDVGAALTRHLALDRPSMIVVPASLTPPPNTSPRWYRAAPIVSP